MSEQADEALLRRRRAGRGLASVADPGPELSPGARALFLRDFALLISRATLENRRGAGAGQRTPGGRMRPTEEALLVRSSTAVFLVWRHSR